jgi:EamA domain-containing membrane protein RarD
MLRFFGWAVYAAAGLVVTVFSLEASPWFALAVALSFIFGPKVWKRL